MSIVNKLGSNFFDFLKDLNSIPVRKKSPTRKKPDRYGIIFYISMAAVILLILLLVNPVWWICYGVIGGLLLFIRNPKKKKIRFFFDFFIAYTIVSFVISISPFLRIKDFQLFHPHYTEIKEFNIIDARLNRVSGRRTIGYYYATIQIAYRVNGDRYRHIEKEAVKWKPFFLFTSFEENKEKFIDIIQEKDFFVFCNPENPQQCKIFYSKKILYLQGSLGYLAIRKFGSLILIGLIIRWFVFAYKNRKK